jgi:hypothetical protein
VLSFDHFAILFSVHKDILTFSGIILFSWPIVRTTRSAGTISLPP